MTLNTSRHTCPPSAFLGMDFGNLPQPGRRGGGESKVEACGWPGALTRGRRVPRSGLQVGVRRVPGNPGEAGSQGRDPDACPLPCAQRHLLCTVICLMSYLPPIWSPREGQDPLCPDLHCVPSARRAPATGKARHPKMDLVTSAPTYRTPAVRSAHFIYISPDTACPPKGDGTAASSPFRDEDTEAQRGGK